MSIACCAARSPRNAKAGDYPDPWDPSVFNLILQFDFVRDVPVVTRVIEPF
jgi:hypothetical protein